MNKTKLLLLFLLGAACAFAALWSLMPSRTGREVVVYTSVDSEFALPLFERFEKETGVKVVYRTDSEASKTTGMAERLLQMKDRPDGDVFWNSEQSFTQLLAKNGALQPYASPNAASIPDDFKDSGGLWTGFGCRVRVLIYNTARVKPDELPRTLEDLALPRWKGKFLVAKPLFGTTRSHFVALWLTLGEQKALALFRAWRDNGVVIAESNGDVRNRVADGHFEIGLTDSDDVFSALDRNKPVDFVAPSQTAGWPGAFLIPNTVALLKNCQRPDNGKLFIDYLLKPETELWLAQQGARQVPVRAVNAEKAAHERLRGLTPAKYDAAALPENILPVAERIYRVLTGEQQ